MSDDADTDASADALADAESRAPRGARGRKPRARRRRATALALRAGRALGSAATRGLAAVRRRVPRRWRRHLPRAVAVLLTVVLIACYTQAPRAARPPRPDGPSSLYAGRQPRLRVALVEAAPVLTITLPGSWIVTPDVGVGIALGEVGEVTLRPVGDGLALECAAKNVGWPGASELKLQPGPAASKDQVFGLRGRKYRADVRVRRLEGGQLRLIAAVELEDYLTGVIGHEMPLRWSDAALHAQAIAARTYALVNLKPRSDHDLKADERSQVFGGVMADDARARAMVEATRGMILTWNGKPFTTYFHSTCGGDTIPANWIFGPSDDIPPLQGATGCKCQSSRLYRWSQEVDLAGHAATRELVLELPVREASVDAWPRGGYVKTATVVDAGGERITRGAADWRRLFKLKSTSFEVAVGPGGTTLTISGRGWGHGVGMCQYGADGFAKEGLTGEQILLHYYPGAKLEKLGY